MNVIVSLIFLFGAIYVVITVKLIYQHHRGTGGLSPMDPQVVLARTALGVRGAGHAGPRPSPGAASCPDPHRRPLERRAAGTARRDHPRIPGRPARPGREGARRARRRRRALHACFGAARRLSRPVTGAIARRGGAGHPRCKLGQGREEDRGGRSLAGRAPRRRRRELQADPAHHRRVPGGGIPPRRQGIADPARVEFAVAARPASGERDRARLEREATCRAAVRRHLARHAQPVLAPRIEGLAQRVERFRPRSMRRGPRRGGGRAPCAARRRSRTRNAATAPPPARGAWAR